MSCILEQKRGMENKGDNVYNVDAETKPRDISGECTPQDPREAEANV